MYRSVGRVTFRLTSTIVTLPESYWNGGTGTMAIDWMPSRNAIGDREAYLGFTLIIWLGILTGFVPEIADEGFNFP